jgi:hypothetical protein
MPWKRMLAYVTGEIEESLLLRIEYLIEENRVLRNQIEKRILLTDAERRTLAEKAVALGKLMADTVTIVKPEKILRWHRRLIAKKFDGSKFRKKHGRPPISPEVEELVVRMAKDKPFWGYDRIAGAVQNLGYRISDQTVGSILQRNGIAPSPERRRNSTWAEFIRRHRDVLWACDFFTTEIWTCLGLTTFYVLFFIRLSTRRIVLGGITISPHEQWLKQVARNVSGWGSEMENARYLIHDRDSKFTASFDGILRAVGTKAVKPPPKSPIRSIPTRSSRPGPRTTILAIRPNVPVAFRISMPSDETSSRSAFRTKSACSLSLSSATTRWPTASPCCCPGSRRGTSPIALPRDLTLDECYPVSHEELGNVLRICRVDQQRLIRQTHGA